MKRLLLCVLFGTILLHTPNGTKVGIYFEYSNTLFLHDSQNRTNIGTMFPDSKTFLLNKHGKTSVGTIFEDNTDRYLTISPWDFLED